MKTRNGILTFLLSLTLLQGCVPDSVTKFKETAVEQEETIINTDRDFTSDDGSEIEAADVNEPTSLSYNSDAYTTLANAYIFIVGQEPNDTYTSNGILPGGSLGDLDPNAQNTTFTTFGEVNENFINNLLSSYSVDAACSANLLAYGINFSTTAGHFSGNPSVPFAAFACTVTLNWTVPATGLAATPLATTIYLRAEEAIDPDLNMNYASTPSVSHVRKMALEVASAAAFSAGDNISSTGDIGTGTVAFIDGNKLYVDVDATKIFRIGDSVDNSSTFNSAETVIDSITFFFPTVASGASADNIELVMYPEGDNSLDNTTNNVTYSIFPDVPNSGTSILTFDNTTGRISGKREVGNEETSYTITAENSSGSETTVFSMAIIDAPEMLSLTNMQVIKVLKSTSDHFTPGSPISSSFSVPLATNAKGTVKHIATDGTYNYISIEVSAGSFEKDLSIDRSVNYVDEDAVIADDPQDFSTILTVTGADIANFDSTTNKYICNTGGNAAGTINLVVTGANLLYITHSKRSSGTFTNDFSDGENVNSSTLSDCSTTVGTETINSLWAPYVTTTLAAAPVPAFSLGQNAIANTSRTSAIVSSVVSTTEAVLALQSESGIESADTLFSSRLTVGATNPSISTVTNKVRFELQRGTSAQLKASLAEGDNLFFEITPDLPSGLTLNTETGEISGTPDESTISKEYTLKAQNIIGSQEIVFDLQVVDYFEVSAQELATSYIFHRGGESNKYTKCRVTKDAIKTFEGNKTVATGEPIDITCFLEAGESDLYLNGLELTVESGPGICEFVAYEPYGFFRYRPHETDETGNAFPRFLTLTNNSCTAGGIPNDGVYIHPGAGFPANGTSTVPVALTEGEPASTSPGEICGALYNSGAINCDTGAVEVLEVSLTESTTATGVECVYNHSSPDYTTINCGGEVAACLGGPVTEDFPSYSGFTEGYGHELIVDGSTGMTRTYNYRTPDDANYRTNRYLANYNEVTSCAGTADTTYDYNDDGMYEFSLGTPFDSADSYVSSVSSIDNPYRGANPFYTFKCLDAAYDVKARVRVIVREWDRQFDHTDGIGFTNPAAAQVMDAGATTDPLGNLFNNVGDMDDYYSPSYTGCAGALATVGVVAPSVGANVALVPTFDATQHSRTVERAAGATDLRTILNTGMVVVLDPGGAAEEVIVKDVSEDSFTTVDYIDNTHAAVAAEREVHVAFPGDNL